MSSLIDPLTECWIVYNALLLNRDFVAPMVYLVLRLETLRIFYMSAPLFDTGLIGLDVLDLAQPVFGSSSQPYKGY